MAQASTAVDTVTRIARHYDSPACRAHVTSAARLRWSASNRPTQHSIGMDHMQQLYELRFKNGHGVRYVRNQKVASSLLTQGCIGSRMVQPSTHAWLSGAFVIPSTCSERFARYDDDIRVRRRVEQHSGSVMMRVFSFVREPVGHAISAYLEASFRIEDLLSRYPNHFEANGERTPAVLSMNCQGRRNATARFLAYLDAIGSYALGDWFYHSWPQALKINAVGRKAPRFAAIGRLENFSSHLPAVLTATAGEGAANWTAAVARARRRHHATEGRAHPRCLAADVEQDDPRVLRKVCALYMADYACFLYPLPRACRRGGGGHAQGQGHRDDTVRRRARRTKGNSTLPSFAARQGKQSEAQSPRAQGTARSRRAQGAASGRTRVPKSMRPSPSSCALLEQTSIATCTLGVSFGCDAASQTMYVLGRHIPPTELPAMLDSTRLDLTR